jgi:hypothetical protein
MMGGDSNNQRRVMFGSTNTRFKQIKFGGNDKGDGSVNCGMTTQYRGSVQSRESDDATPVTQGATGVNRQAARTSFPSPRVHIIKDDQQHSPHAEHHMKGSFGIPQIQMVRTNGFASR